MLMSWLGLRYGQPTGGRVMVPATSGRTQALAGWRVKSSVLTAVPSGVVTEILPVVAPTGTVAVICVSETTVNEAKTELNFTLVVPVKFSPLMVMVLPTGALEGLKLVIFGRTMKLAGLGSLVPDGLVTVIGPVWAPLGTFTLTASAIA